MFKWLTVSRLAYILVILAIILLTPSAIEGFNIQLQDWARELSYYRQGQVFHA